MTYYHTLNPQSNHSNQRVKVLEIEMTVSSPKKCLLIPKYVIQYSLQNNIIL
jgi:hypothetical protein